MNLQERGKVLRQCFRSFVVPFGKRITLHAKGMAIAGTPGATCNVKVQVRYVKLPKPTGRGYVSLGAALNGRPPKWAATPDAKQTPIPRPKRNAGKSALTKIAEKPTPKLKRRFATAEALLAERRNKR